MDFENEGFFGDNGYGQRDAGFFKPSEKMDLISLLPRFHPHSYFDIPADLQARADANNGEDSEKAQTLIKKINKQHRDVKQMLRADPIAALEFHDGHLWVPYFWKDTHYVKGFGSFWCKAAEYQAAGREPVCCLADRKDKNDSKSPQRQFGNVILVYNSMVRKGQPEIVRLPKEESEELDNGEYLDFEYTLYLFTQSKAKARELRDVSIGTNAMNTDYIVSLQNNGSSKIMKAKATHKKPLWLQKGEPLIRRIMEEAEPLWQRVERKGVFGKNLSLEEIDKLLLGEALSTTGSESAAFPDTDFSGLDAGDDGLPF